MSYYLDQFLEETRDYEKNKDGQELSDQTKPLRDSDKEKSELIWRMLRNRE